jgi:hypothetical protein
MFRFHALPLIAAVLVCAPAARAVPGDIDGDGAVTTTDAALASVFTSRLPLSGSIYVPNGDVASRYGSFRDGFLDWHDIVRILRVAGGIEEMSDTAIPYLRGGSSFSNIQADTTLTIPMEIQGGGDPAQTYHVTGQVTGGAADMSTHRVSFMPSGPQPSYILDAKTDANGHNDISLQAGTYDVYDGGAAPEPGEDGTLTWDYRVALGRTVTVSGPTTVDVTAAPLPYPGEVTGTIQTTNVIPTGIAAVSPNSDASAPVTTARVHLVATGVAGATAYTLKAQPTYYNVTMDEVYSPDPGIKYTHTFPNTLEVLPGPAVGPRIAIPQANEIAIPFAPPPGLHVGAVTLSATLPNSSGTLSTTGQADPDTNTYHTAFPPGAAQVRVAAELDGAGPYPRAAIYTGPVTIPNSGDTPTVELPPLPDLSLTLDIRITYPDGSPAPDEPVSISYSAGGYSSFSLTAVTGADGRVSVKVPPGPCAVRDIGPSAEWAGEYNQP